MVIIELSGSHKSIGQQRGSELKHATRMAMEHWMFEHTYKYSMDDARAYGRRMEKDMTQRWPAIMEEVYEMAKASDINLDDYLAYVFRSWNALSDTHSATLACFSMTGIDPERGIILAGVLEDTPPFYLIEKVRPEVGQPFFSVNWAGMPWAVRSLNKAGLSIGLASAFAGTRFKEGKHPFSFDLYARAFFAQRYAIQHAATVDEAVEMIKSFECTCMFVLADKTGKAVGLETCGVLNFIREPDEDGILTGGVFETPEMVKALLDEGIAHDLEAGVRRAIKTRNRLKTVANKTTMEWMAGYLQEESKDGGWCQELLLAATIACPKTGEFWVSGFHPCASGFGKYNISEL